MNKFRSLILLILLLLFVPSYSYAGKAFKVEMFPSSISKDCRGGIANVYDECSDQMSIINAALELANKRNKSVLIVYGAEWCIWCHVFDKYVKGESRKFNYKWQYHDGENLNWEMREKENKNAKREARILNKYVAENFIIAHVEGYYSPNGKEAIAQTGFDTTKLKVLPYLIVLDKKGKFAGEMLPYSTIEKLEIREDSGESYRGFDRKILLNELRNLRSISIK